MDQQDKKIKKIELFSNFLFSTIFERDKSIILIVQLLVMLLVIATFGNNIISNDYLDLLKLIITACLFMMPIMIIDYVLRINEGINSFQNEISTPGDGDKKSCFRKVLDASVYFYIFIFTIFIDATIFCVHGDFIIWLYVLQVLLIILFIIRRNPKNN